ncbi:MAG: DUF308 domain-containing protein [Pseudomonadota bacterium]
MKTDAKPSTEMLFEDTLLKARKIIFLVGVVMSVLGVAALALPMLSSLVVEVFVGWLLTISGFVSLIGAFALRGTGLFVWEVLAGLLTLAAGILLVVFPVQGLIALTLLVALVLFMTGAAQAALAFWMRQAPRWGWAALSALVSIVLGGVILATLPEASAVVLGALVGLDFLSTGIAFVFIARLET